MRASILIAETLCFALSTAQSSQAIDWDAYETGDLGPYPQVRFQTAKVTAPLVHVNLWNDKCAKGYTLLTPHGPRIRSNKALILDERGQLVWHHEERGSIKSFQIQQYKGNKYLTFWVGDDGGFGYGRGYYKMFDSTYAHTHTISALNGIEGDYHEFSITANNTALITAWQKIPYDLTFKGRENGYIWDCLFQEIDIEEETVLFQWRASDHFKFADMAVDSWADWTGQDWDPWDWFHINSVEKDDKGNYLIAARYTNAISYINGTNGRPIWHLGGRNSTFVDLSEGNATKFVDPHMARWDGPGAVTVFDNIDHWTLGKEKKLSRGSRIQINEQRGSARVLAGFTHPENVFAAAEGSMQRLENNNYFLGYGSTNVWAEFLPNGTLICNAHYAPQAMDHTKEQTVVETYRIHKYSWVGQPSELLRVKFVGHILYWSWNGATQVRTWQIDAWHRNGHGKFDWAHVGSYERRAFESSHDFAEHGAGRSRVTAWDGAKNVIGAWIVEVDGSVREITIAAATQGQRRFANILFYGCIVAAIAVLWLYRRKPQDPWLRKAASKVAD